VQTRHCCVTPATGCGTDTGRVRQGMRFALLAPLLLLAGCSHVARTAAQAGAADAPEDASTMTAHGRRSHARVVVAPVYRDARPIVFLACRRAALAYFHHVDQEDADAGLLVVEDRNAWFNDCHFEARLADAGEGATRIDCLADSAAWMNNDRQTMVIERFLEHVDQEIATVRDLRAMVDQTAASRADTGAGSGTSRP
jgi:hypothetical protein